MNRIATIEQTSTLETTPSLHDEFPEDIEALKNMDRNSPDAKQRVETLNAFCGELGCQPLQEETIWGPDDAVTEQVIPPAKNPKPKAWTQQKSSPEKAMSKRNHLEGWRPFIVDGKRYNPSETKNQGSAGGNRYTIRLEPEAKVDADKESMMVKYYSGKEGLRPLATFEGMWIPDNIRNKGVGAEFFQYFLDGLEKQGMKFNGTSTIRKPEVALLLQRAGLKPQRDGQKAILLPTTTNIDGREVPNIYLYGTTGSSTEAIKHSKSPDGKRTFYNVVSTDEAKTHLKNIEE